MRKFAVQVPEKVSRLLRSSILSTPPTWYQPALANPPPILPTRRSRERPLLNLRGEPAPLPIDPNERRQGGYDWLASKLRKETQRTRYKPRVIRYEEDKIRTQFFRDFPFEALRTTSLLEMHAVRDEGVVNGAEWTSLEQRGAFPTVEDLVHFVLNLRETQGLSSSKAYTQATGEFVKLRARHEMATMAAEIEARHWGAEFPTEPFARFHAKLTQNIDTNAPPAVVIKRPVRTVIKYTRPNTQVYWSSEVPEVAIPDSQFHRGRSYVQKWRMPPPPPMEVSPDGLLAAAGVAGAAGATGATGAASATDATGEAGEASATGAVQGVDGANKAQSEEGKVGEQDDGRMSLMQSILGGKKE